MTYEFNLQGKTAIVTGASSGIGEQFAKILAAQGVNVICAARRKEKLAVLVDEITRQGGRAEAVAVDVTDTEQIDQLFVSAKAIFGSVEILINNAGSAGERMPIHEMTSSEWDYALRINLTSVFEISKRFARQLIDIGKPGSIVNVSSIAAHRAPTHSVQYAASKAGVSQLTKSMAIDLAPYGIRVNSIAPGIFASEIMTDDVLNSDEGKFILSQIPLQRPAQTHELDGLILLLASEKSSYMTGAEVVVDGGWENRLSGS